MCFCVTFHSALKFLHRDVLFKSGSNILSMNILIHVLAMFINTAYG